MKSFCDYKYTCLYSKCCTLKRYQQEFIISHLILLTLTFIISTISTIIILKRKSYEFKSEEDEISQNLKNINTFQRKSEHSTSNILEKKNNLLFTKKNYVSDTLSVFNYFNLLSSIFTKYLIIYLILSKFLEVFILKNYLSVGDEEYIISDDDRILGIITKAVLEFVGLVTTYSIIQYTTQVIEYYKRSILLILLYSGFMINYYFVYINETYSSYSVYHVNTYVCIVIICLQIMLCIYAIHIYFYKLSKYY
jgi:hypothetical protein